METSEAPSRPPAKQEGAAAASRQLSSLIARFPLPVVQRIRARQRSPGQAGTELPPLWARYCGMQVAPAPPRHPPSSSRQPALLGQLPPAHVIELGAGRGYLVVVRGSRQPAAAPASGATPPSRARLVAAAALAPSRRRDLQPLGGRTLGGGRHVSGGLREEDGGGAGQLADVEGPSREKEGGRWGEDAGRVARGRSAGRAAIGHIAGRYRCSPSTGPSRWPQQGAAHTRPSL